jgi:hypothetical protein
MQRKSIHYEVSPCSEDFICPAVNAAGSVFRLGRGMDAPTLAQRDRTAERTIRSLCARGERVRRRAAALYVPTQLTIGVDRDAAELAELFDEQDEAVKWMIQSVITAAYQAGAKVGLCGQAPSDHPELAEFIVECGIDSMSVSPDSFIAVKRRVAAAEDAQRRREGAQIRRFDLAHL